MHQLEPRVEAGLGKGEGGHFCCPLAILVVFLLLQPMSQGCLPAGSMQAARLFLEAPFPRHPPGRGRAPQGVGPQPQQPAFYPCPSPKEQQGAGLDLLLLPGDVTRIRVSTFLAFQVAAGGAY